MSFGMWDASVPVFVNSLTNMLGWLDKAAQEKDEARTHGRATGAGHEAAASSIPDGFGLREECYCAPHRH